MARAVKEAEAAGCTSLTWFVWAEGKVIQATRKWVVEPIKKHWIGELLDAETQQLWWSNKWGLPSNVSAVDCRRPTSSSEKN